MRIYTCFVLFCILVNIQAQNFDFSIYQPLKSRGEIPEIFTELSIERYNREISEIEKLKKISKDTKDFILKSSFHATEILHCGQVLFGDTVSEYVKEVACKLLKNKPELYNRLQFHTLKSSIANATSNSHGVILVNTGLIAKLKNEAELAFVLAHEIAHYISEDPINFYLKNIEILKGNGWFVSQSWYDKIRKLGKYSRNIEHKADSIGAELFLESDYSSDCIISTLKSLYYSNLPIDEVEFTHTFFNSDRLIVPNCFFSNKVPTISEIKEQDDEENTHPGVLKRVEMMKAQLSKVKTDGVKYLVSETKFKCIQEITFFEQVRLNILAKEYGKAIYNSYCLLQKYPKNKYLEYSIAKALYGLARYKNKGEYHKAAESYTKIEGESYQVHFFLRQLTKKQLTAVALNYIWDLMQKYENDNCLEQLETGLINDLVIHNEFDIEEYNQPMKDNKIKKYDERKEFSQLDLQKVNKEFYRTIFYGLTNCTRIIRKFDEAGKILKRKEEYERLSFKEKAKYNKQQQKYILENGLNYKAKKVYILDPYVDIDAFSQKRKLIISEDRKVEYNEVIMEFSKYLKFNTELLSYEGLNKDNVERYNEISVFKDVFYEVMSNDIEGFYPIGSTLSSYKDLSEQFLAINGIYDSNDGVKYFNLLVELKTGNIAFVNDKVISGSNISSMAENLKKDLMLLKF